MHRTLNRLFAGLMLSALAVAPAWSVDDAASASGELLLDAYQRGVQLSPQQKVELEQLLALPGHEGSVGTDEAGGPDDAGYVFIDSNEPDGPAFGWVTDDSGTWTEITALYGDDVYAGPFPIGFDFPFYGTDYSQFWLGSNGWISLVSQTSSYLSNYAIPNTANPNALIAPFWDDLNLNTGAPQVHYGNIGDSVLVIQYEDVQRFGGPTGAVLSFQVLLHQDGTILLQYNDISANFNLTSETIGIENADGTIGLQVSYNTDPVDYPADSLAIRIAQVPGDADVSGQVTDFDTGLPIADAIVTIAFHSDTTDAGGDYAITGLFPGTNDVTIWAPGYNQLSTTVDLVSGQNTADFQLVSTANAAFYDDFETDTGFWITYTVAPDSLVDWERGTPGGGTYSPVPASAHSGSNVYATRLAEEHRASAQDYLELDLPMSAGPAATLTYWQWMELFSPWDGYNVEITTDDGATWVPLQPVGGYPVDPVTNLFDADGNTQPGFAGEPEMWEQVDFSLAAYAGQTFRIRFHLGTSSVVNKYGVAIDDIAFYGVTGPGGLEGTVTDAGTGDPLVNARVQVRLAGQQDLWIETRTNALGQYTFILPIDTYDVTCVAAGYETQTATDVALIEDSTTTVDFAMVVQSVTVPVTGTVVAVEDGVTPAPNAIVHLLELDVTDTTDAAGAFDLG
ncbi:MAG TPA: hypothetical protein ENI92_08425, partial [Bacteroidetes bacterium]|nr:hypothetical protein [Bacteroidota bacterium]